MSADDPTPSFHSAADDATSETPPIRPDPMDISADPPAGGRFELLNEIGEGGMGVVYRARQLHPVEAVVAVKVIKMGMDTRRFVQRFLAERQVMARLDHTGIARVIDVGNTVLGRPYYAMEYVDGAPITRFADKEELTLRQRLELFVQVCNTVTYAHTRAVLHRDLKPSNLLAFRDATGKPTVKVIDFGVAKVLDGSVEYEASLVTETGMAVGTLYYMSPEQAEGSRDIDVRADVYSLGAVLYELLAGLRPLEIEGAELSPIQRRELILRREPSRPSTRLAQLGDSAIAMATARQCRIEELASTLRDELEWIPLKAMRRQRERRYQSAQQLAEDVQNYLDGKPLIVGLERKGYATRKWLKRHRVVVAAACVSLACLAGTAIVSTYFATTQHIALNEARQARDKAEMETRRAREAEEKLERTNEELTRKAEELEKKTREVEEALKTAEQERDRAQTAEAKYKEAFASGTAAQQLVATQVEDIEKLEASRRAATERAEQAESAVASLKQEREQLAAARAALQTEADRLRGDLQAVQTESQQQPTTEELLRDTAEFLIGQARHQTDNAEAFRLLAQANALMPDHPAIADERARRLGPIRASLAPYQGRIAAGLTQPLPSHEKVKPRLGVPITIRTSRESAHWISRRSKSTGI